MVELALALVIIRRHVGSSPGLGACMYVSKSKLSRSWSGLLRYIHAINDVNNGECSPTNKTTHRPSDPDRNEN
jgi:hypothetical protein